jgi:hypothetical protein
MRKNLLFTAAFAALLFLRGPALLDPAPGDGVIAGVHHPTVTARSQEAAVPAVRSNALVAGTDFESAISDARRQIRGISASESLLSSNDGSLFFANHSGQRFTARFQQDGVLIRSPEGSRDLKISRPHAGTARISATGTRIEYERADGSVEWFDNSEAGLEHGMTLVKRPPSPDSWIHIGFEVSGHKARPDPASGNDLVFVGEDDKAAYGYRNLKAWDASGRELEALLAANETGMEWRINDHGARYPLTIDPLIVNAESIPVPADRVSFGSNVSVDGDAAVVGDYLETTALGTNVGAVYVFRRSAGTWALEARLGSLDPAQGEQFGRGLALDGDVVAVGVAQDNNPVPGGTIQLFQRFGSNWTFTNRIFPPTPTSHFADVLAMEAGTLVVGRSSETGLNGLTGEGRALVYQVDFGSVSGPQVLFAQGGGAAQDQFGTAVAIKGGRIAIGAPGVDADGKEGVGAVYVFAGSPTFWSQQAKLTVANPLEFEGMGRSVAIDGDLLVAGAPFQSRMGKQDGVAYAFSRSGVSWTFDGSFAAPTEAVINIGFGSAVAIAGNWMAISTTYFKAYGGQVLLYQRVGKTWLRRSALGNLAGDTRFPILAMDGSLLLAGFPIFNNAGTAVVYSMGNPAPGQEIAVFTGPDTALAETISGASLNFGQTPVETDATWPVTVFNDGTTALQLSEASLLPGASEGLSVDPISGFPGGVSIDPGATAKVIVRGFFAETAAGAKSGTLRLASNDADEAVFDLPFTLTAVRVPAPAGLTISREFGQAVLRYPHLQFFVYRVDRSTDLQTWSQIGFMDTEFDFPSGTQMKIFRDFTPPPGKAFYRVTVD